MDFSRVQAATVSILAGIILIIVFEKLILLINDGWDNLCQKKTVQ